MLQLNVEKRRGRIIAHAKLPLTMGTKKTPRMGLSLGGLALAWLERGSESSCNFAWWPETTGR